MCKTKIRYFIAGFLAAALCIAGIGAAAGEWRKISVYVPDSKIYLDGSELQLRDEHGNRVEQLLYNGTTYLPVRSLAAGLGKNVAWDSKTGNIYIGWRPFDGEGVQGFFDFTEEDLRSVIGEVSLGTARVAMVLERYRLDSEQSRHFDGVYFFTPYLSMVTAGVNIFGRDSEVNMRLCREMAERFQQERMLEFVAGVLSDSAKCPEAGYLEMSLRQGPVLQKQAGVMLQPEQEIVKTQRDGAAKYLRNVRSIFEMKGSEIDISKEFELVISLSGKVLETYRIDSAFYW